MLRNSRDQSNRYLDKPRNPDMLNVFEAMDRTIEESVKSMNQLFDRMNSDHFGNFRSFGFDTMDANRGTQTGFQDHGNKYTYGVKMSRDAAKKTKINEKSGTLIIRYQDSHSTDRSNDNSTYRSSSIQMMSKSVSIPRDADPSNTSASFENGVLTITVPKRN